MDSRWTGSAMDYKRSMDVQHLPGIHHVYVELNWSSDSSRFWYLRDMPPPEKDEIHFIDCQRGIRYVNFMLLRAAIDTFLGSKDFEFVDADFIDEAPHCVKVAVEPLENSNGPIWLVCDVTKYSIELDSSMANSGKDDQAPELSSAEPIASESTGVEITLQVYNAYKHPISMLWVDAQGETHFHQDICIEKETTQLTYEGHAWKFVDIVTEEAIAWYCSPNQNTRIEIHGVDNIVSTAFQLKTIVNGSFNIVYKGEEITNDSIAGLLQYKDVTLSPNEKYIAAFRSHIPEETRYMTLLEMAPLDGSPYPDEQTIEYANPGDDLPYDEPVIINIETKEIVTGQSSDLYSSAYSNSNLLWHASGEWCMFVHNARGHQCVRVIAMHCQTGETRVVIEETSTTFVDHTHAYFKYMANINAIVWSSERSGYRHLYLYSLPCTFDAIDNLEAQALTSGEFVVSNVEDYMSESGTSFLLSVRGYYAEHDPYYVHYMLLNVETKVLTPLTDTDATHESIEFSPDYSFCVVWHSRIDLPPVVELRRTCDGQKLLVVERADVTMLLSTGWHPPMRFSALGRDNKTRIYGIAIVPMSSPSFPAHPPFKVIEYTDHNPLGSSVPKTWSQCLGLQSLAELGFVVVQIDGMGTANRSKAFHDVCYQNLADSGSHDRVLWLKALARSYPHLVDISGGVGIFGSSSGGQSAVASLLRHGDTYKVAVADCGNHDSRIDRLWFNELWMGYPVTSCYLESANVSFVENLQRHQKLLLMVGLMDNVVDPASTMQLVQALIDADKDFEVLPFPQSGHRAMDTNYGSRKKKDFFVRHLLGQEPRHEGKIHNIELINV